MKLVRTFVFCSEGVAVWIAQREDAKFALTLDYGKRFDKLKIDSADAVHSDSEACWHESPESAMAELLEAATRKLYRKRPGGPAASADRLPAGNRRAQRVIMGAREIDKNTLRRRALAIGKPLSKARRAAESGFNRVRGGAGPAPPSPIRL
jgi:hypothetical protein